MTNTELMIAQVHQIELDKWYQGEKQGSDPGETFVRNWIKNNAAEFRRKNQPEGPHD